MEKKNFLGPTASHEVVITWFGHYESWMTNLSRIWNQQSEFFQTHTIILHPTNIFRLGIHNHSIVFREKTPFFQHLYIPIPSFFKKQKQVQLPTIHHLYLPWAGWQRTFIHILSSTAVLSFKRKTNKRVTVVICLCYTSIFTEWFLRSLVR